MQLTADQAAFYADRVARAAVRAKHGVITPLQLDDLRTDIARFEDAKGLLASIQAIADGKADIEALGKAAVDSRPAGFDLVAFRASQAPKPDDLTLAADEMTALLG